MRKFLSGTVLCLAFAAAAQAAPADQQEQSLFDQLVSMAGATNGAARACGASAPDLAEHQATARRNLQRYAQEYGYAFDRFDALFQQGTADGREMMLGMRRTGVDGCSGVLQSFQHERNVSYENMKQAIAEATDGLPEKKK